MGRLSSPRPDPQPNDDGWIVAAFPVVCALHQSPIPAGREYCLQRWEDGKQRRICRGCTVLQRVIGQPLEDPREGT